MHFWKFLKEKKRLVICLKTQLYAKEQNTRKKITLKFVCFSKFKLIHCGNIKLPTTKKQKQKQLLLVKKKKILKSID